MRSFRSFVLLLTIFCFANRADGQVLSIDDFNVGFLKLRSPIDSILIQIGKPDHVEADDVYHDYLGAFYLKSTADSLLARIARHQLIRRDYDDSDFISSEYRRIVIWYNKFNNLVKGFDIQDSSFFTARGLKIGDSLNKLRSLYGNGILVKDPLTDGPYDLSFHDYTQIRLFSRGDYHLAFFTKGQRVTKIIVFFRLSMYGDEWNIGPLKLDKRFDAAIAHLGKPDSTTPGDYESTGFYFPKLVIWRDNHTKTLCAMDIYDSTYVTYRGLRVGSPSSDFEKLYGDRGRIQPVFRRLGPYDYTFKDYAESTTFDGDPYYLVVFTKKQKVVKLLFYVGVHE